MDFLRQLNACHQTSDMIMELREILGLSGVKVFAVLSPLVLLSQFSFAQQSDVTLLTRLVVQLNKNDRVFYHQTKDWFVKCDYKEVQDSRRCELSTPVIEDDEAEKVPFSISLIMTGKSDPPLAVIRTPLDFHLSKGVEMRVDKSLVGKLSYRSCHQTGCVVPFSMIGSINRRMLAGSNAAFEFQDLLGKKETAQFSLLGITNALRISRGFF